MNLAAIVEHSSTGVILRVGLYKADDGQGITGLTHNSAGLSIATITDNESAGVIETVSGTDDIEDITTLGTYAAPTAGKVRFKEVDSTGFPGLYEIQLADARFAVASATTLYLNVTGATNLLDANYFIPLDGVTIADISAELSSYGVPTVTQMNARTLTSANYADASSLTSLGEDIADVQARIPVSLSANGNIRSDVEEVNETVVTGSGTALDPWGP